MDGKEAGLLCVLLLALGLLVGIGIGRASVRVEAVERNHAHYDTKTGSFTWNGDKP